MTARTTKADSGMGQAGARLREIRQEKGMSLVDAFVNAAMILSGMGPVQMLNTDGGKIFAGLYAIISGIVIFGIAGLALAPLYHRMLHRFHLQDDDSSQKGKKK